MITPNNTPMLENSQEMTPEQAKASLGIATFLQDQMMPQAPVEQEMAPMGGDTPVEADTEQSPENAQLTEIKTEIQELRQLVEEAINENDDGQEKIEEPAE